MAKRKTRKYNTSEDSAKQEIDSPMEKSDYKTDSLNMVSLHYNTDKNTHDAMKSNWTRWNNAFRSHLDPDPDYPFRSHVFVPVTEKIVRALLAKYIVSMFLRKPFFDLKPRTPADIKQVEKIKKLLTYTFDKMPDFIPNMIKFIQMMLIYGTAIGKVSWRKIERNVRKSKDEETKLVTIYNGPYFEVLDMENFFIDTNATKLNGFHKIHRAYKTMFELKTAGCYSNLDKVTAKAIAKSVTNNIVQDRLNITGQSEFTNPVSDYDTVELLEYWTADDSRVITVANENTVIRDIPNPYWHGEHPFVSAVYEPLPFEFYGKGLCETLYTHNVMINKLTNQILDNVELMNNKMWIATIGSVNANQIVSKAGKIIWADDINALKEVTFSALPSDVYRMLDRLNNDCEMATAASSMSAAVGQPISKEQSATEVSILSRLGNEIHALNIMLLEIPVLTEVVRKSYELIKQNFDEQFLVQITDEEEGWDTFDAEDIALDVDIIPKIGLDVMSKESAQQNLISLLQVMKDMPGYDINKIIKLYVENLGYHLDEFKETEKLVGQVEQESPSQTAQAQTGMAPGIGNVGGGQIIPEQTMEGIQ